MKMKIKTKTNTKTMTMTIKDEDEDDDDDDDDQSINQVQSSLLSYVRHGCPVARARGSCLKRKTIKL